MLLGVKSQDVVSLMSNTSIWRPYTQEKTSFPSVALSRAEGAYLYTKSGQKIFDGISSWWLTTHGHCQPEIVEAIQRQSAKLDQVTFANFTHEAAEELAELLLKITPSHLSRVFFSDNGSTAVEVALKMALQSCAQVGNPQKTRFIAFEGAYHGDTVGAMSVSGSSAYNRPYQKTLFDVTRAKHPTLSTAPFQEWITEFEKLISSEHENIAGVIIEPLVQGAGGMIMWPEEAVQKISTLCHTYGVILIFDEVMTGFGRTGQMFALDRLNVAPDLLCLSKGLTGGSLPLAATLVSQKIFDAFYSDDKSQMLFHGHSFTGNPISCAAAVANIKLFLDKSIFRNLIEIENIQKSELGKFANRFPISDGRVCGTIAAFEFGLEKKTYLKIDYANLTRAAFSKGLFIRPLGSTIYLMPTYCAKSNDIMQAWDILAQILPNTVAIGPQNQI